MNEELRKSGINIIRDVYWGTHFLQFYKIKEDLIDILVPYFKTGLENNELCMWITSEPLIVDEAKAALKKRVRNLNSFIKKGQIEIIDYTKLYTKSGRFNANTVLKGWIRKEKDSIKKGFDGLRLSGNIFWLEKRDWKNFIDYEKMVDNLISDYKMIVICSYFLDKCELSDIIELVSNHEYILIRKESKWHITKSVKRKKMVNEIKEIKEDHLSLWESIEDPMYLIDKNLNYINANKKYQLRLRLSLSEILKQNYKNFHSRTETEEFRKKVKEVSKSGNPITYEYKSKRDGRYFIRTLSPVKDFKTGEITSVIINSKDVTESKRLEEQLQIRQRIDSLGILASGIAHDFNNLLAVIMGNINMLNKDSDRFNKTQKDCIKDAEFASERAAELIYNFQKFTSGTAYKKEIIDIYDLAKDVFDILIETTDRLIGKRLDLKPEKFYIEASPSDINQVLMNLGTNAVQAIEARGFKKENYIRITAEEYKSKRLDVTGLLEGEYVHILFEDNGEGMNNEIRGKAFDPMFTTRELSGKKRGQGLGLAIVYNIVTRIYKGCIEIESKKGKGTIFHIYLPKAYSKKKIEEKEIIDIKNGSETILVVDDEEMILRFVKNILKRYGYNVLTAVDGEQALDIYKENKDSINVVILDLTMPKMSGKVVFEKMSGINKEVKVIISSGHSEEYTKEGILSLAKGFVKKPYKLDNLLKTVRIVLDL